VARHDPVIDFRRAHVDADHVGNLATAISAAAAWQACTAAMMQAGDQFAPQFAPGIGIDGAINRFVRHVELALMRKDPLEGSRYLLRRLQPSMVRTTPQQTLCPCNLPLPRERRRQVTARTCA